MAKPIESIYWYWNPSRPGVQLGPEWFRSKLHELSDELEVTWDAYHERWLVFMRQPRVQHPIGMGWTLLCVVQDEEGSYMPIDERVLAHLYVRSRKKWGDGLKYFEAVQREIEKEKEAADKADLDENIQQATEAFTHSQISVGYGPSNGSKFSTYHS